MDLLCLDRKEVYDLLDMDELLEALAEGFKAISRGEAVVPARNQVTIPGAGYLMVMPAWRPGAMVTVKLITVFDGNHKVGLPSHQGLICAFDPDTGSPLAMMDAAPVTALRTAGCAALSVRHLSRENARVLTIIGAGVQGESHLKVCSRMRDFEEIRIASYFHKDAVNLARSHPRARAVESTEEAVRGADVLCLCSASDTPVFEAAWVSPGTHITSVGYAPPGSELPRDIVSRARLVVESRISFEPPPAGCCELTGIDPATGTELGEILQGSSPGRRDDDEITLYKAMGHAIEDLAAANLVYALAKRHGKGSIARV
jgi:alanine dehydrogenase